MLVVSSPQELTDYKIIACDNVRMEISKGVHIEYNAFCTVLRGQDGQNGVLFNNLSISVLELPGEDMLMGSVPKAYGYALLSSPNVVKFLEECGGISHDEIIKCLRGCPMESKFIVGSDVSIVKAKLNREKLLGA